MDEERQSELIRSVLREVFPDECRRVGKANFADIVRLRGKIRFVPAEGGSRMDLTVLTMLASAAAILGHGLTVAASSWRDGQKPDGASLKVKIEISLPPGLKGTVEPQTFERMLTAVVARLVAGQQTEPAGAEPDPSPRGVLVLAASPTDQARLRSAEESREIRIALGLSAGRDRWPVHDRGAVRLPDLSRALLDLRPRVVHFSGHGSDAGELVLENDAGRAQPVSTEALAELFAILDGAVECVVLNACYSERQARVLAPHVPWVIGSPSAISDRCAIAFSVGFYQAVGNGIPYPGAHRLGCSHMQGKPGCNSSLPLCNGRPATPADAALA